jgi:DNA-binding MarR family transcriptional regulator
VRKSGTGAGQRFSATEARKREWRLATRWRRRAEAALSDAGLTLSQWMVLDALSELIAETEDAVSQNEVCERVELDRATISAVMRRLEKKQLVSRGIDLTGRAWRIFLTPRAEVLLRQCAIPMEYASSRASDAA